VTLQRLSMLMIALAIVPMAVHAHHSWNAVYGGGEELTIDATITSKPFRNPHNAAHIQVANDAGEMEAWTVEWRGERRRDGEPPPVYDLNPGDAVVIFGRRAVDAGVKKIQMERLTRPADGLTITARRGRNRG